MGCKVTEDELREWIRTGAPALAGHVRRCPRCRARAEQIRAAEPTLSDTPRPETSDLPERVGGYRILGLIGKGGQGLVYEAEQEAPRRRVALKILKASASVDPGQIRLFKRETQTLSSLQHPGITTVYQAGQTDEGLHYFAMELVHGVPLDMYAERASLSTEDRLKLVSRVCDIVAYAHEHGVIHRDLKPANVLVDDEGNPKILDFGLARLRRGDGVRTSWSGQDGGILGTVRYMSPEQARGLGDELDQGTDVYSLGVMLYELVTGRAPYKVGTLSPDAIRAICEEDPESPRKVNPGLDRDIEAIILKALEKEPEQRYRSVRELADDIDRWLRGDVVLARRRTYAYVLQKKVKKNPRAFVVLSSVVAVLVASVMFVSWQQRRVLYQQQHAIAHLHYRLLSSRPPPLEDVSRALRTWEAHPELMEGLLVWAQGTYRIALSQGDAIALQELCLTLRQRLRRGPERWPLAMLLREIYAKMGEAEEAARLAERYNLTPRDSPSAWYLRAFATLDLETALASAEKAARGAASSHQATLYWAHVARLRLLSGRIEEALTASRHLIEMDGSEPEWCMLEVRALAMLGRFDEALASLDVLLDLRGDTNPATAYRQRAVVRLCRGDCVGALQDYNRAGERRGETGEIWWHYQRAVPLSMLGRFEQAAKSYRYAMARLGRASYPAARLYLLLSEQAAQLRRQGRHRQAEERAEEAQTVLRDALRVAPTGSWLERIFSCLAGHLSPQALIDAADPADPEQVCEGFYYAAEAALAQEDREKAEAWFTKCLGTALPFDPDANTLDPMSEYHLARWRLSQLEEKPL